MNLALTLTVAPWLGVFTPSHDTVELSLADDAPEVELDAYWEDFQSSVYELYKTHEQLQGFAPEQSQASYPVALFRPFLPADPVEVGDTWRIDAGDALPFLRQLHPGATTTLHHGFGASPGAWACLRAVGPRYAEIALRVHAEFKLAEGEGEWSTSWFTPAQFAGTLVVDREHGTVHAFRLGLPARDSNVDVNVPLKNPPVNMPRASAADIGFVPRMEVASLAPGDRPTFSSEISEREARLALAQRFYAFCDIEWLDVDQALARSRETHQPMHIVVLFGSLDDESC